MRLVPISGETPEGRQRRLEAARRGSETVAREFDRVITRKQFTARVGIHANTLARWERAGIIAPELQVVMGSPTRVFTNDDVRFGRRLITLLRDRPGELTLAAAAVLAARKR